MKKPVKIIATYRIENPWSYEFGLSPELEKTETTVHLSPSCICSRYTFRGVPAGLIDIVIDNRLFNAIPDGWECIVQVVRKEGRYDGKERDRLVFRLLPSHQCHQYEQVDMLVYNGYVGLLDRESDTRFERKYELLRSNLQDDYDPRAIILWHWTRYYQHIPYEDASALADEWAVTEFNAHSEWTLAEANRSASRALYKLSRCLGWRKLTLRERRKLGQADNSPQWQRTDTIGTTTGCGEYTLSESVGIHPRD